MALSINAPHLNFGTCIKKNIRENGECFFFWIYIWIKRHFTIEKNETEKKETDREKHFNKYLPKDTKKLHTLTKQ